MRSSTSGKTHRATADFAKDYIQRALDDEMALILIEADWWK
jgi:hypothetical protein